MKYVSISVDVSPFVCLDCGQMQFMSDIESLQTPGNCSNADCEGDNVIMAGPRNQAVKIDVNIRAEAAFLRAEKQETK